MTDFEIYYSTLAQEAAGLLMKLIRIPSFSREENQTAACICAFLEARGVSFHRKGNNVFAQNRFFNAAKPTILLNSHHDTVKPGKSWTRDPFHPETENGKIYGLGSNDAGGCLVALMTVFIHYYHSEDLAYNLIFAATAEEEISGRNGIESILSELGPVDFAIVGEPTQMQMAVAEKGLMVLDCTSHGTTGHAAREEGENAIYKAIRDIDWFRTYQFEKVSPFLGPVKMSVTTILAGEQHNVIPSECGFTVDIRLTEDYTHEDVLAVINKNILSDFTVRSTRLKPSGISMEHPFVKTGQASGLEAYGSPTTSDQALMPFPSVKIGPGDSSRSHAADEFIYMEEIKQGIGIYIDVLDKLLHPYILQTYISDETLAKKN
jgi:acetylornithine deacetylase